MSTPREPNVKFTFTNGEPTLDELKAALEAAYGGGELPEPGMRCGTLDLIASLYDEKG